MILGGSGTLKIISLFQFDLKSSPNDFSYTPIYFFFCFSHQTEKSIIHPALKEEKGQSRLRQWNIVLKDWILSLPLSQSSYVGNSDLRSSQCVVLSWKPGTRHNCFAEVLGAYVCNSAQWELCFQNGMWCCIIMSCSAGQVLPYLILMHCFLNVYFLTLGWVKL